MATSTASGISRHCRGMTAMERRGVVVAHPNNLVFVCRTWPDSIVNVGPNNTRTDRFEPAPLKFQPSPNISKRNPTTHHPHPFSIDRPRPKEPVQTRTSTPRCASMTHPPPPSRQCTPKTDDDNGTIRPAYDTTSTTDRVSPLTRREYPSRAADRQIDRLAASRI